MKYIHIENSYKIWNTEKMGSVITHECWIKYGVTLVATYFNRTWEGMFLEWYLHNIGYYITKPFCCIESIRKINLRCKDVDIEEKK